MNLSAGVPTVTTSPILLPTPEVIPPGLRCVLRLSFGVKSPRRGWCCLRVSCAPGNSDAMAVSSQHSSRNDGVVPESWSGTEGFNFEVRNPFIPARVMSVSKLSTADQASLLLAFIGCTTGVAFISFVVAAVRTLSAMRRAALSFAKLADTARDELPSTMAAIRLSGMEISDLTLELSDLSQEIADGVTKSAQAVQAAEAGVRQIGSLAHQQTMTMIQERASLPKISLQPVVVGAAKKTTRVFGQATKTFLNIISRSDHSSVGDDGISNDRIDN